MSAQWSEEQIRMLINERKNGNEEYHRTPNRNKRNFWEDFANKINRANNINYFTGEDCNKKFLALTRAYYTARAYKKAVVEANEGDKAKVKKKRSLVGEHYYEKFSTEFWKEPGTQHPRTSSSNAPRPSRIPTLSSRLHPSGIPSSTPSTAIADEQQSSSENPAPQSSRLVTPSTETSVVSRPVTPTLPRSLKARM